MGKIHASTDPYFEKLVSWIVPKYRIESIVETGTYDGMGSSQVLAKQGIPLFTIECNPDHFKKAKKALARFPKATPLFGLSLRKERMIEFLKRDKWRVPNGVLKDVESEAQEFYVKEIESVPRVEENLLPALLNDTSQLVYLDSAGGIGLLEALTVFASDFLHRKVLLLDDCNHVKHFRTLEVLKAMGKPAYLLPSGRLGWVSFMPDA